MIANRNLGIGVMHLGCGSTENFSFLCNPPSTWTKLVTKSLHNTQWPSSVYRLPQISPADAFGEAQHLGECASRGRHKEVILDPPRPLSRSSLPRAHWWACNLYNEGGEHPNSPLVFFLVHKNSSTFTINWSLCAQSLDVCVFRQSKMSEYYPFLIIHDCRVAQYMYHQVISIVVLQSPEPQDASHVDTKCYYAPSILLIHCSFTAYWIARYYRAMALLQKQWTGKSTVKRDSLSLYHKTITT